MRLPLPKAPARGPYLARQSALFALMLILLVTVARYADLVSSVTLIVVLGFAFLSAGVGFVALMVAFRDIWRYGSPGLGASVGAAIMVTLALLPFIGLGVADVVQPPASAVSTDPANPPDLVSNSEHLPRELGLIGAARASDALQLTAYPELLPRSLPLSSVEGFAAARKTINDLGWTIGQQQEPEDETAVGLIMVEARTLLFAIPADLSIRIQPDGAGSRVDVNAALRIPIRDLGENARLIGKFLDSLNETLSEAAG